MSENEEPETQPLTKEQLKTLCKNLLQQCEMRSRLNRDETAVELGVSPDQVTDLQLVLHYAKSGRAEQMRAVNGDGNYWVTGERLQTDPRDLPPGQLEEKLWETFLIDHPGLVPTFVPPCLRQKLESPPCYQAGEIAVCMDPDHPPCRFQNEEP